MKTKSTKAKQTKKSTNSIKSAETDNSLKKQVWDLSRLKNEFVDFDAYKTNTSKLLNKLLKVKDSFPNLEPKELLSFFKTLEKLLILKSNIEVFSYLQVSQNSEDESFISFDSLVTDYNSNLEAKLVFVENKIVKANKKITKLLLTDSKFKFCSFYVEDIISNKKHYLDQQTEELLSELYPNTVSSWSRLYEGSISQLSVDNKSLDSAISKLFSQNEKTRSKYSKKISESIKNELSIRSKSYDNLVKYFDFENKKRGYVRWDEATAKSNCISLQNIDSLVESVDGRYSMVHKWNKFLAQQLNEKKLSWHNRMAPVVKLKENYISFKEAQNIVLSAYESFDEEVGQLVKDFFKSNSIHAIPQKGKTTGAFCISVSSQKYPFILLNWGGTLDDVLALAHECGHGLHAMLSHGQSYFHFDPHLVLAETASVFGEMLVFEYLLSKTKEPEVIANLFCKNVNDNIITIFRQITYYKFESLAHNYRSSVGDLNKTNLGDLWMDVNKKHYGSGVNLTSEVRTYWSIIPHFLSVGYVYSYAFGQLLTLSLFSQYKQSENKTTFIKNYKKMLSLAGKGWPKDLTQLCDINIENNEIWENGLDLLQDMIEKAIQSVDLLQ